MEIIKIELYHEYSNTDQCHYFGLVTENLANTQFVKNYIQWIWFHLGSESKNKDLKILPYSCGKLIYKYKYSNDAKKQAQKLLNRINKFLKDGTNISANTK